MLSGKGRSTGIRKINRAIEQNGSPKPKFETDEDRSFFLVGFPVHPKSTQQVTGQVTCEVGTKLGLSRDQVEILEKCFEESRSADLMALSERSNRTKFRDQVLNPLLADALVEMTQPNSPNSSTQKYRTTEKGKKVVQSLKFGESEICRESARATLLTKQM